MLIAKKLLAPVFTGVLVAFLFIAAEIIFIPRSELSPALSIEETVTKPKPPTKNEGSRETIQHQIVPGPQSPVPSKIAPSSPEELEGSSGGSHKLNNQYPKDLIQNSEFKIQNYDRSIQNSQKPTLNSKLLTLNSQRLNKKTDNMNVLFIGVDKGKLLACSVFTINYKDKYQAGGVFLPTYSRPPKYKYSFAEIYEKAGVEGLKQVIEKEMGIKIELYYSIERELLKQIETYIDPIYINNQKLEIYNLFTMAVSPQDEEILGALTRELLKPGVFFTKLPRLLLDATKYIKTDFKVTFQNLKFHYNNIVNLDTHNIKKQVLPTHKKVSGNKIYYEIDAYHLHNSIYEITR
ncbi:MAG: hypothetical protein ACOX1Y_07395 [Zhaonellaceae bacterium]|jgi:anionic cell wall polymer biosynthesis LytR-Cps2A-Psr (LCP) family protein|nr:hypothetical protein [Clostridia bacterium]